MELDIRGFAAEALGTFLLTMTVGLSAGEPLAVGGILWLGMCITCFRSGAQFNPAVTLSVLTRNLLEGKLEKNQLITLLINIPVQISAGILAGMVAWGIGKYTFFFEITEDVKLSQAFFCELLFTMLLCMNVHMAGRATRGLFLEGGMIAMTLGTCAFTVGHITRNCVNPAVELGLGIANYANTDDKMKKAWIYIIAPILGGACAAGVSKFRARYHKRRHSASLNFSLMVTRH
ncbi:hypothetical protein SteCoe_17173 [Stentor coeruleus]|uniref:Aquaporin n=1 Tax=Stentor coeruleus TaxID=5963 RepID=A0A1R2BZJ9_9CILI|nr:hypothetical protein SteCoe_17173 [Stentor coeruleus]